MKNLKETEELFDGIFRDSLENGSAQVPPGVWEGVSASIGSGSAIAGAAVKTALWMKAAIAVVAVSAIALVTYQIAKEEPVQTTQAGTINNKSTETQSLVLSGTNNPDAIQTIDQNPGINRSKNYNTSNDGVKSQTPLVELPAINHTNNPDPIYSIDANFEFPLIDAPAGSGQTAQEQKPVENQETPVQPEPKELNPTTEYTYVKDSSSIFIPTAVTADGDGINDTYIINLVGEESVEIIIYSIENEVLFRTTNKYQAWNCKLPNGDDAPAGSYLVKVIYKFKGKEKQTTVRKLTIIK